MSESPKVNAVIGFGTPAARAGATPVMIKRLYQGLFILSTIWAVMIEPIFTNIPLVIAHRIDQLLIAGDTVIYLLCQQFGWVSPKDASYQTTEV